MIRRKTKQKSAILRILEGTRSHPTAHSIYEEVKKEIPNVSKGTIYRNLKILQESKAISEIRLEGTQGRFEFARSNHYHFRCEQCGGVFCLDASLPVAPALPPGFSLTRLDFDLRGICDKCGKERKA